MSKINANAIREKVRKDVSRLYRDKILDLQDRINSLRNVVSVVQEKYQRALHDNEELKDKVNQYEDWISRLQEFCNMGDEEREQAIARYKAEKKISKVFDGMMGTYMKFFDMFNVY